MPCIVISVVRWGSSSSEASCGRYNCTSVWSLLHAQSDVCLVMYSYVLRNRSVLMTSSYCSDVFVPVYSVLRIQSNQYNKEFHCEQLDVILATCLLSIANSRITIFCEENLFCMYVFRNQKWDLRMNSATFNFLLKTTFRICFLSEKGMSSALKYLLVKERVQ